MPDLLLSSQVIDPHKNFRFIEKKRKKNQNAIIQTHYKLKIISEANWQTC